ncbi:MAG: hypothetical protein GXP52_06775 [Deltaproteobacteria bacterium]|nr:hypothetical protein [Deltaproteobacteria bacterium]
MNKIHHPSSNGAHTFFIPVMGIGFTVDSPIRVAKYGISSTISLVDDTFIEQMRRFHCERVGEPYEEIPKSEHDHRAKRITAYLNLIDRLVKTGVEELRSSPFEPGSEITRCFELLPDCSLKSSYLEMLGTGDVAERRRRQEALRRRIVPGSIDVNIMTKLDRDYFRKGKALPHEFSDALAALRGYANSTLRSSIVFSAGLNPRLYSYAANFNDFLPDETKPLKKQIVLKVSDYRSAVVQGKFLAKRGLWVSEYRIESGLNCGGHAFPSKGNLMGSILEEFKQKKEELIGQLHKLYSTALSSRGLSPTPDPYEVRFRVSGGVGTAEEHEFLRKFYGISKVGWGTPFLLVPEVTNVDNEHIEKLINADDDDVYLSASSPLNVPFWNLRTSASEEARRQRIREGRPGSPCPKGHARIFNTEFTTHPDCIASRSYISKKLPHMEDEELTEEQFNWIKEDVLAKSCLCHDLSGGATLENGIDPKATPAICCGPAIVNFSKIATLEEMVDHIYGRLSLLTSSDRPHMFIRELSINLDYLKGEMEKFSLGLMNTAPKYFREFKDNLATGIEYYMKLAEQFVEEKRTRFLDDLREQKEVLENLFAVMAREPDLNAAG